MSGGAPVKAELSREMTLFQVTMMGVGMMIGAGVFVATGIGIGMAGPGGMLLALSLNGLIAFFSVMTYAELGSALPKAGGGYSYVQESRGGFPAFLTGWISWFGHAVAGSLYAITFAKYTLHFLAGFGWLEGFPLEIALLERITAVTLALFFLYINYRGAGETGRAGAIIAIGQTLVLLLIGLGGVFIAVRNPGELSRFTPFMTGGWNKVLTVMGFSLVGFEGYEVISNTAEEVLDARRNVPRGIFMAIMIVITTYLLITFAAVMGGGTEGGSLTDWFAARGATGFAEAVGRLHPLGNYLALTAAVFASTSALNATIFSSTRVSFALGRDGHLPEPFSRISRRTRIPHVALMGSGLITVSVAAFFDVETVMAGASLFFILLFSTVTFFGMKIRLERGHELTYGYLIPLFPVIPVLSIALQLLIGLHLLDMAPGAYAIAGGWLLLGIVYYLIRSKTSRREAPRGTTGVLPLNDAPVKRKNVILTAVKNEETAGELARLGNLISRIEEKPQILVSVVPIPFSTPLEEAGRFSGNTEQLLSRLAEETGASARLRYAHNTTEGLIRAAEDRRAELMLLGWTGKGPERGPGLGRTLDTVIRRAACDLAVLSPGKEERKGKEIRKILCAAKGNGPQGKLIRRLVRDLARPTGAKITIIHVTREGSQGEIPRRLKESVRTANDGLDYEIKFVRGGDPVQAIVREAASHNLLVIGASAEPLWEQLLFGSLPKQIAAASPCPVLMVRRNRGLKPWFKRWFL